MPPMLSIAHTRTHTSINDVCAPLGARECGLFGSLFAHNCLHKRHMDFLPRIQLSSKDYCFFFFTRWQCQVHTQLSGNHASDFVPMPAISHQSIFFSFPSKISRMWMLIMRSVTVRQGLFGTAPTLKFSFRS